MTIEADIEFAIHHGFRIYGSGAYSSYNSDVAGFLSGLSVSKAAAFVLPRSMVQAFQPVLFAFPSLEFEEGFSVALGPRWSFNFAANQIIYEQLGQGTGLGFAPALGYELSRDWAFQLGAAFCAGGPASGTVIGLINLRYLF